MKERRDEKYEKYDVAKTILTRRRVLIQSQRTTPGKAAIVQLHSPERQCRNTKVGTLMLCCSILLFLVPTITADLRLTRPPRKDKVSAIFINAKDSDDPIMERDQQSDDEYSLVSAGTVRIGQKHEYRITEKDQPHLRPALQQLLRELEESSKQNNNNNNNDTYYFEFNWNTGYLLVDNTEDSSADDHSDVVAGSGVFDDPPCYRVTGELNSARLRNFIQKFLHKSDHEISYSKRIRSIAWLGELLVEDNVVDVHMLKVVESDLLMIVDTSNHRPVSPLTITMTSGGGMFSTLFSTISSIVSDLHQDMTQTRNTIRYQYHNYCTSTLQMYSPGDGPVGTNHHVQEKKNYQTKKIAGGRRNRKKKSKKHR